MSSAEGVGGAPRCTVRPFFLETPQGPMYAVHRQPPRAADVRGHVLVVPGFNEEMNRCRSMLTLLGEHLAAIGYGTLLIDLHGTGDSAGHYVDGRWQIWREDIAIACRWLESQPGGCTAFAGVRMGAMLAADALTQAPPGVDRLILWQPVTDGKQHLTQFLRVRIAAMMDRPDLPKESTATMRAQLAAGQSVEIGGYEIHPDLARAIDEARLNALVPRAGTRVLWLEQPPPGGTELSMASVVAMRSWQDAGIATEWKAFEGPAFWQQHERVLAPEAITLTVGWLQSGEGTRA